MKIAIAILNCILARQLCFEDPSCSAILEIIPRVCGPVPGKKIEAQSYEDFLLVEIFVEQNVSMSVIRLGS